MNSERLRRGVSQEPLIVYPKGSIMLGCFIELEIKQCFQTPPISVCVSIYCDFDSISAIVYSILLFPQLVELQEEGIFVG